MSPRPPASSAGRPLEPSRPIAIEAPLGGSLEATATLAATANAAVLPGPVAGSAFQGLPPGPLAGEARPVVVDRADGVLPDHARTPFVPSCPVVVAVAEEETEKSRHVNTSVNNLL